MSYYFHSLGVTTSVYPFCYYYYSSYSYLLAICSWYTSIASSNIIVAFLKTLSKISTKILIFSYVCYGIKLSLNLASFIPTTGYSIPLTWTPSSIISLPTNLETTSFPMNTIKMGHGLPTHVYPNSYNLALVKV